MTPDVTHTGIVHSLRLLNGKENKNKNKLKIKKLKKKRLLNGDVHSWTWKESLIFSNGESRLQKHMLVTISEVNMHISYSWNSIIVC